MKKSFRQLSVLFILSIFVLLTVGALHAQENLLINPGFEDGFRTVSEGREVAEGWQPWNLSPGPDSPSYENAQPLYEQVSPDSTRVRSGSDAQQYYTDLYFTHVGGVFQRVTEITPGTELRFSIYAHVWSSNQDDPEISEEPGGVLVEVGIDPTGGTDATSSNITWSVAAEQYDAYRQYSVIETATSNAVTVFVRSSVDFPQRNNFIFLDDAVLEVTEGSSVQVPTNTAIPQPTNTPVPQPTNTPIPEPTNTPEPVEPTQVAQEPTPTQETGAVIPTNTDIPTEPTNTELPPFVASSTPTNTTEPVEPTEVPVGGAFNDEFPSTIIHTVRSGDTVSRLAVLYGSTTEAILEANSLSANSLIFVGQGLIIPVRLAAPATTTPTATPVVVVVTPTQEFGTGGAIQTTYIVRPGDTLIGISRLFNTTVAALAQANGIVNPSLILAGQQLVIPAQGGAVPQTAQPTSPAPAPQTYLVQPGDNLYRISLRFGKTMKAIADANGIVNVNRLLAGTVLVIP